MEIEEKREYDRERARKYRLKHPARVRAYVDKWQAANREKVKTIYDNWRKANPEKVKEACKRWRLSNPGKALVIERRWRNANREKLKAYWKKNTARRRAIKRNAQVNDLVAISKVYARCEELRKWFDVVVDHIVPLSRKGMHCADNLQIIYRSDNGKKHAKLNYKPKVIFT